MELECEPNIIREGFDPLNQIDGWNKVEYFSHEKQQRKISSVAVKNARERLEVLYPDAHTLDVIFNNNVFTVSLIIKLKPQW